MDFVFFRHIDRAFIYIIKRARVLLVFTTTRFDLLVIVREIDVRVFLKVMVQLSAILVLLLVLILINNFHFT